MATGCHTCGGTLTGPVGTTREASKVTMVFETVSVCGARVPVPLVTKAPEAPPTAQSVVLNWPVILRVSSLCHAPASSMLPPVQARKGAGRGKNPFLFAMLFEKNIESFSERQPVGVMSFLLLPPAFPRWRPGAGREAGSWQQDAIRNILGQLGSIWSYKNTLPGGTGALSWTTSGEGGFAASSEITMQGVTFDASCVVPTAEEDRPVNVALPVILYLGLPA